MAILDRAVYDLNNDVYYALKKASASKQTFTESDTQDLRRAILKDGVVDASEADLLEELQKNPTGNIQVFMGRDTSEEHLSIQAPQGSAQNNLRLSNWDLDVMTAKAKYVIKNVTEPVYKPLVDVFTYQYSRLFPEGERQGNCGPASASMVLKEYGIAAPHLTAMRKLVGAPHGPGRDYYALTTQQVGESVRKVAAQKGVRIDYKVQANLGSNVNTVLAALRNVIQSGKQAILLTSNINSGGKGHYIVVKDVLPNGSIVVNDPALRDGEDFIQTRKELSDALIRRHTKWSSSNDLISFERKN